MGELPILIPGFTFMANGSKYLSKKRPLENIPGMIAGIILLSFFNINGQERDNLKIFNELVDSSVTEAVTFIPDSVRNIKPILNSGILAVFNSEIISELSNRGYNLVSDNNSFGFQYTINNATTSYGDIFRGGFLGDYYISRKLTLSGSYNFTGEHIFAKNFNYTFQDTVNVDSINTIENSSYPFTQGRLPAEPLFPGILEPLVAIGTAALAVILFFTIRSK